jgi:hypothetical protein
MFETKYEIDTKEISPGANPFIFSKAANHTRLEAPLHKADAYRQ